MNTKVVEGYCYVEFPNGVMSHEYSNGTEPALNSYEQSVGARLVMGRKSRLVDKEWFEAHRRRERVRAKIERIKARMQRLVPPRTDAGKRALRALNAKIAAAESDLRHLWIE